MLYLIYGSLFSRTFLSFSRSPLSPPQIVLPETGAMSEEKEKLENFGDALLATGTFTGNMVPFIYKSLEYSNLRSLAIKGFEGGFKLNDTHVISLTMAILKAEIKLVDLLLTYHEITDVGLEEISRLFKPTSSTDPGTADESYHGSSRRHHNSPFEGLDLEGNDITGTCFEAINLASSYDCPLVVFNISCNPLCKEGKHCLAKAVAKNKTLRQLSINSCGFDLTSMILLITNLKENSTLQLLYMDRPLTEAVVKSDETSDHLARWLTEAHHMFDLSLRYFNMLDLGAELLSGALANNRSITSLNLESNNIGIRGAEALASYLMIREGSSLKTLCLSYNSIGDDGAIAFAEAISRNRVLKKLTMKSNKIGNLGLHALADGLAANQRSGPRGLNYFSLFGNEFSNSNGKQWMDLITSFEFLSDFHAGQEAKWGGGGGGGGYGGYGSSEEQVVLDFSVYVVDGQYNIAEC